MDVAQKSEYTEGIEDYLEEYNVYDYFYELMKEVITERPKNPLDFLIDKISKNRTQKCIIVGPPGFSQLGLGRLVAGKVGWKYLNMTDWIEREKDEIRQKEASKLPKPREVKEIKDRKSKFEHLKVKEPEPEKEEAKEETKEEPKEGEGDKKSEKVDDKDSEKGDEKEAKDEEKSPKKEEQESDKKEVKDDEKSEKSEKKEGEAEGDDEGEGKEEDAGEGEGNQEEQPEEVSPFYNL